MTWPAIVRKAIDEHGGTASLAEIYDYVADRRPTQNPAWREQVRKVCQLHTQRISRGRYTVRGASQNN
ncbi:forkhead box transcription factor [Mycobacteroides abscessus]|nr:forkhead box transcription factor [Mycobacteroides abscessus]SKW44786.1 Uncharacterised protein [Mycobacteroides abscessus subsp. abscessus]